MRSDNYEGPTELQLDNTFTIRRRNVRVFSQATSRMELTSGLGGVAWLAATRDGGPIHASLEVNMVEGALYDYSGLVVASRTYLAAFLHKEIFHRARLGPVGTKADAIPIIVTDPGSPE